MQTITTAQVRPAERLSFWQDTVCAGLVRVHCQATKAFSGDLRLGAAGRISVAELSASRHIVDRNRRSVAQDDDACAMVFVQLEGEMDVVMGDAEYAVTPGSLFLYDMRSPIQLRFTGAFRHLAFRAPWEQWVLDRPASRGSRLLASRSPMLRVGAAAAAALFEAGEGDEGSGGAIRAVVDLLAAAVGESMTQPGATPAERALTARFERLLDERLCDAALTADGLARGLGVSPQYLNRVLARSGASISRRILTRRLERCARDLGRAPTARVSDVALRWGFNDLSHFSRAFRAVYGRSPGRYQGAR